MNLSFVQEFRSRADVPSVTLTTCWRLLRLGNPFWYLLKQHPELCQDVDQLTRTRQELELEFLDWQHDPSRFYSKPERDKKAISLFHKAIQHCELQWKPQSEEDDSYRPQILSSAALLRGVPRALTTLEDKIPLEDLPKEWADDLRSCRQRFAHLQQMKGERSEYNRLINNFTSMNGGSYYIPEKEWPFLMELLEKDFSRSELSIRSDPDANRHMVDSEYWLPIELPDTEAEMTLSELCAQYGYWIRPLKRNLRHGQSILSLLCRAMQTVVRRTYSADIHHVVIKSACGPVVLIDDTTVAPHCDGTTCTPTRFSPRIWKEAQNVRVMAKSSFAYHWPGLAYIHPLESKVLALCQKEELDRQVYFKPQPYRSAAVVDTSVYSEKHGNRLLFSDKPADVVLCQQHWQHPPTSLASIKDCKMCLERQKKGGLHVKGQHRPYYLYAVTSSLHPGYVYRTFCWEDAVLNTLRGHDHQKPKSPPLWVLYPADICKYYNNCIPDILDLLRTALGGKDRKSPVARKLPFYLLDGIEHYITSTGKPLPVARPTASKKRAAQVKTLVRVDSSSTSIQVTTSVQMGSQPSVVEVSSDVEISHSQQPVVTKKSTDFFCVWPEEWKELLMNMKYDEIILQNLKEYKKVFSVDDINRNEALKEVIQYIQWWCTAFIGVQLKYQSVQLFFAADGTPSLELKFMQNKDHYALCIARAKKSMGGKVTRLHGHKSNRSVVLVTPWKIFFSDMSEKCWKENKYHARWNENTPVEIKARLFTSFGLIKRWTRESKGNYKMMALSAKVFVESVTHPLPNYKLEPFRPLVWNSEIPPSQTPGVQVTVSTQIDWKEKSGIQKTLHQSKSVVSQFNSNKTIRV